MKKRKKYLAQNKINIKNKTYKSFQKIANKRQVFLLDRSSNKDIYIGNLMTETQGVKTLLLRNKNPKTKRKAKP